MNMGQPHPQPGSPLYEQREAIRKHNEGVYERHEKAQEQRHYAGELKKLGRDSISAMTDVELSDWQTQHPIDSPQFLVATYEWNLQLLNRQIAAAKKDSWRAVIGTLGGAIIGVMATLIGVFVPRLLDRDKANPPKQQVGSPANATANANPQRPISPNIPTKEVGFDKPIELKLRASIRMSLEAAKTDEAASQGEESLVQPGVAFVAGTQPPGLVQPGDGALDGPAHPAQAALALGAANDRQQPPGAKLGAVTLAAVSPVGQEPVSAAGGGPGALTVRGHEASRRVDQGQEAVHVGHVGPADFDRQRDALTVAQDVVLAASAGTIRRVRSGVIPPFTARMFEASTSVRLQSIWLASASFCKKSRCSRAQMPASSQALSRRQQLMPEPQPISCGRSSHWMPVLSTNRIPVSACR